MRTVKELLKFSNSKEITFYNFRVEDVLIESLRHSNPSIKVVEINWFEKYL